MEVKVKPTKSNEFNTTYIQLPAEGGEFAVLVVYGKDTSLQEFRLQIETLS